MGAVLDLLNGGGSAGGGTPSGGLVGGGPRSEPFGASAAPAPEHHGHGGLSGLWHDTLGLVTGAVPGLAHLAAEGATDVVHNVTRAYGAHEQGPGAVLKAFFVEPATKGKVATGFGKSFARTGSDIAHPTHFTRAYREGGLAGKLLEDIANASIVAAPVSKAFTGLSAGAEETATGARAAADAATKEATTLGEAREAAREAAQGSGSPIANARFMQADRAATAAEAKAARLAADASHLEARSATLGRVARGVQTASKLGDRGSNAPFLPFEVGAKLAARGFRAAEGLGEGSALGRAAGAVGDFARSAGERRMERHLVDNIVHEGEVQKLAEGQPVIRAARERAHSLADPVEEGAHQALIHGHANSIAETVRGLEANGHHDLADQLIAHTAERLGYQPESLRLAVDILTDPKHGPAIVAVQERMAKAEELALKQKVPDTEAYLAGRGEPNGPSPEADWQVTGTTPNPTALLGVQQQAGRIEAGLRGQIKGLSETREGLLAQRALAEPVLRSPAGDTFRAGVEAGRPAAQLDERLAQNALRLGIAKDRLARLPEQVRTRLAEVAADANNAPKRYRAMLKVSVDAGKWLAEQAAAADKAAPGAGDIIRQAQAELIVTLHDAVDADIDPSHVIGGRPGTARRGSPPGTLPAQRKTGAREFARATHEPTNIRDETKLQLARAAKRIDNETAATIQHTVGRTGVDLLGEEAAEGLTRQPLVDAMAEHKYVPWNPRGANGGVGFDVLPAAQVKPTTLFIPEHILTRFRRYQPREAGIALRAFDRSVRVWKAGVLPLSPRWQVGNFFGNTIMGTFGAGISPDAWAHAMIDAKRILDENGVGAHGLTPEVMSMLDEGRYAPAELLKRGQAAAEFQKINELGTDIVPQSQLRGRLATSARHPIQTSYNLNGYIDDMNRLAIFLVKAKEGLAPAEREFFLARHPEFHGLDDVTLTKQWAITESLRSAGDFTRLTPFERNVARRVVPFYPWLRHITRLTYDLAAHHPLRVAWALHLTDMFGEPQDFSIVRGSVPMGHQWFLHLPQINPFDNVFSNLGAEGPQGPLGTLNPAFKLGANLIGYDLAKGGRLEMPPGYGPADQYGHLAGGVLGRGQYEYLLGSLSPQFSAARVGIPALLGHQPVVRYPTGEAVRIGHADIPTNPSRIIPRGAVPFARLLGLPTLEQIDLEQIAKRAAERRAQAAAARASYRRVRR